MLIIVSLLGNNLKFLRKRKKLTQDEMLVGLDIQRSTWSNYENGYTTPDFDTIIKVSNFFEVTVDDLLKRDVSADVQVIEKKGGEEKDGKSTGKSTDNSTGNASIHASGYPENDFSSPGNEPTNLDSWVLMGILRRVEAKLDGLRVLVESKGK